jgi:hypothetical protein
MGIHFSGTWFADYLPVQSSESYDNTGAVYNTSRILDANYQFNETAYMEYSPLYLPTQFALAYGLSFAAVAAVIVHVALYHGRDMWRQFRLARHQEDDVHMRLMKKYRDAEDWWYARKLPQTSLLSCTSLTRNSPLHRHGRHLFWRRYWLAHWFPSLGLCHLHSDSHRLADSDWHHSRYH